MVFKFDGHYDHRSMLMENLLCSEVYWGVVEMIEMILNKDSAKGIWDSIKQKYKASSKMKHAQLQTLRRESELLGVKEGENYNLILCKNSSKWKQDKGSRRIKFVVA